MLWVSVAIALIGLVASEFTEVLAAVGIGSLVFLAAFAGGAFIGFLFGVPRVLSNGATASAEPSPGSAPSPSRSSDAASASAHSPNAATQSRIMQSNTNLERISDWLTTLIVGAALTQLYRANDMLSGFGDFLATHAVVFTDAKGVKSAGVLPVVGPVVLIFGSVCGFLYMYLSTRLVLIRLFYAIEQELSGGEKLGGSASRVLQAAIKSEDRVGSFVQEQIEQKRRATVDDALGVMLDMLYKEAPDRVIEIGGGLAGTGATQNPDYWLYMAAAFGQKHAKAAPNSEESDSDRDNALDCARRAIAINLAYRQRLQALADPTSTDNDLASLHDDPTFKRIVGSRD